MRKNVGGFVVFILFCLLLKKERYAKEAEMPLSAVFLVAAD